MQLVKKFGIPKDFLPPKKLTNNMAIGTLETRREALEHYLQKLINRLVIIVKHSQGCCSIFSFEGLLKIRRGSIWAWLLKFIPVLLRSR